jgi:hypothetical protein
MGNQAWKNLALAALSILVGGIVFFLPSVPKLLLMQIGKDPKMNMNRPPCFEKA